MGKSRHRERWVCIVHRQEQADSALMNEQSPLMRTSILAALPVMGLQNQIITEKFPAVSLVFGQETKPWDSLLNICITNWALKPHSKWAGHKVLRKCLCEWDSSPGTVRAALLVQLQLMPSLSAALTFKPYTAHYVSSGINWRGVTWISVCGGSEML